jgi:hypothetical protein
LENRIQTPAEAMRLVEENFGPRMNTNERE